jgi:hypothetical protein
MPTTVHSNRNRLRRTRTPAAESRALNPRPGFPWSTSFYALTIFLGAFLLFQVQLILGKFVLPRFGGGPSVWSASLLTFQILLLAGYGYAAALTHYFSRRIQGRIHLGLLSVSALAMAAVTLKWNSPILSPSSASLSADTNPVFQIVFVLVSSVGFPCLLLSASSPLLQKWLTDQNGSASAYRLYALSNLGSVLGLLSYPFVVERLLRLSVQAWVWACFYLIFLAAAAFSQRQRFHPAPVMVWLQGAQEKSRIQIKLLWLALSSCGSVMLLATTNLICQEVAVVPLLWVLPLGLYLLSFIICFDHTRWYRREIFHPIYFVFALLSLRTLLHFLDMSNRLPLVIFCTTLFAVCMVCHGELARLKPVPQRLTGFYLMISAGGAIGSAFVVLVSPHLFNRFWEFQIALIGCGVLLGFILAMDVKSWIYKVRFGRSVATVAALALGIGGYFYTFQLRNREDKGHSVVWRARNFFGVKTVLRFPQGLVLRHGRTIHGTQSAAAVVRDEPTMYYRRGSGIGLLLENYPMRMLGASLRLGVIGMGAGTLAAYGQAGDVIRFYELDPDIVSLSQGPNPIFTFVKDSPAQVEIATGDARVVLQQEFVRFGSQKFDVLAVDAFSGDAIPVHLLTREAMAIYLRHLRGPSSVIAFHVSNRSVDLRPVVAALADEFHLASLEIFPPEVSDWILLSADPSVLGIPALTANGHSIELARPALLWTDDYSNLYSLLRSW